MKNVSCVDYLSIFSKLSQIPNCCSRSICRGQIAPILGNMDSLLGGGGSPMVRTVLRKGYTLLFPIWPNWTRSPTNLSCCVHPLMNSYLMVVLHALMQKNAVEPITTKESLGFYNRTFLVPKLNNWWRSILDLSTLKKFLKTEKFKMETITTDLQTGEWVSSIDFKDTYFHIQIQNQSWKYLRHVQG